MGKIITTRINDFSFGMQNDIRSKRSCRLCKNFDSYSFQRLKPYPSSESGNDTVAREFANFLFTNQRVYGLGVQSGTSRVKIWYKDTFTDGTWTEPSAAEAGALTRETECFVFYRYGGASYIFGGQTNRIWKYAVAGTGFTDADLSVTHTTIAQGLVHSKDDILYIPYDNIIAKNNAGSWTAVALTLPAEYVITSISERGNFLAIACKPLSTNSGKTTSKIFLWDRDSTLTTLSETVDWGAGNLEIIQDFEDSLLTIGSLNSKLIIKYMGTGEKIIIDADSAITLSQRKQKYNDRLHFMLDMTLDGVRHWGTWSVGRNAEGRLTLTHERAPNNDTDPNSQQGFIITDVSAGGISPIIFIAYIDGSSNKQVSKTIDASTFSATSVYETTIDGIGAASLKKKLLGVTVTFDPLPAAGQVVLKYKADAETSFTTIFTHTTDDSISHSSVNIESSGVKLPEFNEIQFRLESTGGAEITGFEFDSEITGKRSY